MSRRHSMENLELMNLTPDKMNVRTSDPSAFNRLLPPPLDATQLVVSSVC